MFRIILVCIIMVTVLSSHGQANIIPSSGFEVLDCPGGCSHVGGNSYYYASLQNTWQPNYTNVNTQTWYYLDGFGSPDIFCKCLNWFISDGVSFFGVPYNRWGFNYPRTDSVYAGVGIYSGTEQYEQVYKEYMRVRLKEPLKKGYGYKAGLYWSLCDSCAASDKLGMVFSKDSFLLSSPSQFVNVLTYPRPQVEAQEILRDTSGWNLLEDTFIADGGELYLTIGLFAADYDMHREPPVNGFNQTGNPCQCIVWNTYFYIDDVFLYEYPEAGVPESEIQIPNIFTPNGDGINDLFELTPYLPPGTQVTIYNRWGNEVFQHDNYQNNWDGNTKFGQKASPGVYFYIIKFPQGLVKKGTITISI